MLRAWRRLGADTCSSSDTQPYEPTFCVADIVSCLLLCSPMQAVADALPQDLTHLSKLRAEMPLWEQRRTDVYAEL
jgi:hypothetical protein